MYVSEDAEAYAERAVMHEQLAATTADDQARKMHQSMAEAYRRKAEQSVSQGSFPSDQATTKLLVRTGY